MDMSKYKALFISETTEHLQAMNENLLLLEKDPGNSEAIATVFRNAHSIKGMAASMGFEPVRNLSHALEDLMDDFRQSSSAVSESTVNLMFKGMDLLESMVAAINEDKEITHDITSILTDISALRGAAAEKPAAAAASKPAEADFPDLSEEMLSLEEPESALAAPAADLPTHTLRVIISSQASAPGVRGFILYKRLEDLVKIIAMRPDLDAVKAGQFLNDPAGLALEIDMINKVDNAELFRLVQSVADVKNFEINDYSAPAIPEPAAEEQPAKPEAAPAPAAAPAQKETTAGQLPQTVRVKTQILDDFINAVGEMILIKSSLREIAKRHDVPGLSDGVDRLDRLVREFHDRVMSIRMMPLDSVTQRLPRVVRDLAQQEGKKINFELRGGHIELDRAILEQLADPFLHLLRNAVNHGIEPPAERLKAGKDSTGAIVLEGLRERDLVLIEVRDDGRGLNPAMIKKTAIAKGIIKPEEAETMSDDEAVQLIFVPGFSTAREVGMVSGRGVGMDVVRDTVEGVGGNVTVSSTPGKGTTITLHLPRTIAIINVLLIRLNQEVFAVPIGKVLKTVEILPYQIRESQRQRYFLDRQDLIPIKELHKYLDMPVPQGNGQPVLALLVEAQKRKVALMVDELLGQEEAFIRPLGKPLERISGLSGVTILGDGRIVFLLDTIGLL